MDVEIGLLALGVPISNDTTHNISRIGPVSVKIGQTGKDGNCYLSSLRIIYTISMLKILGVGLALIWKHYFGSLSY